uniref:NADH dehydrogenase [ubiquinone] 1 alpha subcomplex subunit 13 n=1 Tax=Corethrella appendiculata TaxID=1370023 RepID=U5EGY7_9DIPT
MSEVARLQDLPPKGGYEKIPFKRVPAKSYFHGSTIIAAYFGISSFGLYLYYLNAKRNHFNDIEIRSAKLATMPLLLAERDREYLKQLRRNRDEEAELMKNVPGWEVGTWYGEPIYKTVPKEQFIDPSYHEFYVHAHFDSFKKRAYIKFLFSN